jgi:VanZ family protein
MNAKPLTMQDSLHRLLAVLAVLAFSYALALWQPVRAWYSDVDKLAHGVVFAGVFVLLVWALPWRLWAVALLALAAGGAVELHQLFLPGFTASWADWLADGLGIGLAWAVLAAGQRLFGWPSVGRGPLKGGA